jgi:hypothetical protein
MTATITALPTGTVAEILDQAADYLTRHGWKPTGLYDNHRNCPLKCGVHRTGGYRASILGAIRVAVFGAPRWYLDTASPDDLHTYTAAVEWFNTYLLAIGHAGQHGTVFDWQTSPGRTRIHAIAALQHAASAYRRHARRAA